MRLFQRRFAPYFAASFVAACLGCGGRNTQTENTPQPTTTNKVATQPTSDLLNSATRALSEPVTAEFTETPLGDAMAFLARAHNVTITIDQPALDKLGLGTDTPVVGTFEAIPLNDCLFALLKDIGLQHVVEGDAIVITSDPGYDPR